MPQIFVHQNQNGAVNQAQLRDQLIILAAEHLSCDDPDGSLTKDDFSVTFHAVGVRDHLTHDIQIRIEAGDFPKRQANLDERADKIREGLKDVIRPELRYFVWVRLSPAGFSSSD